MAFIRLPLGIRVALEYSLDNEYLVNIYHVTTDDPITSIKLASVAQIFIDWAVANILDKLSSALSLNAVVAHSLDVENGEKIILPVIPAEFGLGGAEFLPNNIALVVSLKTALTGRSFQGRSYIAGMEEAVVQGNYVSVAYAASMIGDFLQLDADLLADSNQLVVASFVSEGAPRAEGIATPVDSFQVGLRVDSQRRRLPRT